MPKNFLTDEVSWWNFRDATFPGAKANNWPFVPDTPSLLTYQLNANQELAVEKSLAEGVAIDRRQDTICLRDNVDN